MTYQRYAVLDRDGTLIVERHYLSDPDLVELIPGVAESLRRFNEMGLGLVVITNQSAIGRGLFDTARLALIHHRMCSLFAREGVRFDGIYFCPHLPDDNCQCRKPRTALVELAARELGFNPRESFAIGDKACDIELGRNMAATTFLVRTGYGAEVADHGTVQPDYVVDNFQEATLIIGGLLAQDKRMA